MYITRTGGFTDSEMLPIAIYHVHSVRARSGAEKHSLGLKRRQGFITGSYSVVCFYYLR